MKRDKEPDGMYVRERVHLTAEDIGTPEAKKLLKGRSRCYDVYLTLDDYRAAYEKALAEVDSSDKDPEHLARRRNDLSAMRDYIDYTEKALRNREWKRAVLCGIALGITSHKALHARLFEPDVLHMREGRKSGGPKAAAKRIANNKEFEAKFAPLYQRRVDQLMGSYNYTKAVRETAKAFCREDGDDKRHNYGRVLSLTKDVFKKSSKSRKRLSE